MIFGYNIGLTALSSLLYLAKPAAAEDCLDAPGVPGTVIGIPFTEDRKQMYACDTKWKDGLVVSGLEVWSSAFEVKGIRVIYSDGSRSPIRGQTDRLNTWGSKISGKPGPPPEKGYGWDKIEWGTSKIEKIRFWGDYNWGKGPKAVGRIQVWPQGAETDKNKILDVGSDVGDDSGGFRLDNLGSGVLIGIRSISGGHLESLEFIFMDGQVRSAKIVKIDWPESIEELNKKQDNIDKIVVEDSWIKNSNPINGSDQNWSFGSGKTLTQTRTVTEQKTEIVGGDVSVSVSAEVEFPMIVKVSTSVSTGAHWETQSMQSTTNSDSAAYPMTITQSSTLNGPLKPQTAIHCTVHTYNSNYKTDFVSTVQLTMSTGKTYEIQQPGQLASVLYTSSVQDCKTVPLKDVPNIGAVPEGTDVSKTDSDAPNPSAKTTKRSVTFNG
ncbi:unnamed protein product [Periconia digitata]|uniref:Uncharacterized protein n=1 Tax=Periconia digitata TaxID=1303443 RepID=A0A9W4UW47_9PLEO|nr:unnamed protein product [Periconia digitata]